MTGVVIVTHGPLAKAFIESMELIIGGVSNTRTIGLFHGENVDTLKDKIKSSIEEVNNGDGVLVFTDLFGGSPNNMSALSINELGNPENIKCFVGVNLPILLEAITMRSCYDFKELVEHISEIAKTSIFELGERLRL
jgi:mannose PTS system EIIA component